MPAYPPSSPFLPSALAVTPEVSEEQVPVAKIQQKLNTNTHFLGHSSLHVNY